MPRCPNGSRRNKSTGNCEPARRKTSKSSSPARNKTVKSRSPSPVPIPKPEYTFNEFCHIAVNEFCQIDPFPPVCDRRCFAIVRWCQNCQPTATFTGPRRSSRLRRQPSSQKWRSALISWICRPLPAKLLQRSTRAPASSRDCHAPAWAECFSSLRPLAKTRRARGRLLQKTSF